MKSKAGSDKTLDDLILYDEIVLKPQEVTFKLEDSYKDRLNTIVDEIKMFKI